MADIPGLIEGASEGAGLGDRFLGHVERCAVLLHLVDGTRGRRRRRLAHGARASWSAYGHGLAEKPELVGLNKIDAMTAAEVIDKARGADDAPRGRRCWLLSGATGQGVHRARCAR